MLYEQSIDEIFAYDCSSTALARRIGAGPFARREGHADPAAFRSAQALGFDEWSRRPAATSLKPLPATANADAIREATADGGRADYGTSEADGLVSTRSLAERAMPVCPVPAAVPKLNLKKGTTTLGFKFKHGVILAVDSRASSGQYIASQTVQKVLEINNQILGTMAGGAADCQYWERVLGMECRLWELRNGSKVTIAAASKILAGITYGYRNHGLSMGTMVAGWDGKGPDLYYVDDQGTRIRHHLFSVGSGSIYAYGVLDNGYNNGDLTPEQAADLGRKAIFHATYRDGGSGGWVSVYWIHGPQEGKGDHWWTKISRDDQTKLFDRYMGGR